MDLVDISNAEAQTKARVHATTNEFYKKINLSYLLSSLVHRDNVNLVLDIYCTPTKPSSFTVHFLGSNCAKYFTHNEQKLVQR